MRCVLPAEVEGGEGEGVPHLTTPQLKDAVTLLLKYKDCFVGANGIVGWTDRATHLIDTGSN